MPQSTLKSLEKEIKKNNKLQAPQRKELLRLMGELKKEIKELEANDRDAARSVANFTRSITHESTKQNIDQELVDLSLTGLQKSVQRFESSHPQLVSAVNSISNFLASMGI